MKNKIILDFHLFDGEGGGEGAGATASTSGSEQDVSKIQYGKSEGEGPATSQVGSDKGGEAGDLEAEFAALIGKGGKFHELYGQKVSDVIQNRFKNQADLQGQVNQITEDLSPMFLNYGLKPGDYEGLKQAMANDDSLYQAGAEKAGLDVNQYKEMLKLRADSERLTAMTESFRQEQAKQAKFAEWEGQAEELQQAFPNFDLAMEIEHNDQFAQLISNGVDVRTAFMSTHMDEILNGANAYAQKTATQNVVNTIQQRAARPAEGALNNAPALQRKSDPSSLTDADFDEINRRAEAGIPTSF